MTPRSAERASPAGRRVNHWLWLGPLLYMVVVGLFFACRYAGQWAESDSATFTSVIRAFIRQGRLVPVGAEVYPNGYAYQAISAFIVALTGLDVATLQQLVYPLVASLVVLLAWALYREVTGSARGAAITTVLLFTQPEFLFVLLRSSHEKFTRALMMLCLLLLIRNFRARGRPPLLAVHVALFCLTAFALIASNNLLANSFFFAIATALVLGWLLAKRYASLRQSRPILRHLLYATLICFGLVYAFTSYIYPPAQNNLLVLKDTWDRIAGLFLDVQAASNPYTQVGAAWVGPAYSTYFLVSIANWIILVTSFAIWAYQGLRWLRRGEAPRTQTDWLLWLLYAAFAVQGGLSFLADASGALSSNLQHRLFPSFSMIAVALVGVALARWRPHRFGAPVRAALAAGVFCVAILSVLKATNEPALSNKWTFYRSAELTALTWSDAHLSHSTIWTEFDERLAVAYQTAIGESANQNLMVSGDVPPTTRDILLTEVTRLRSSRLQLAVPVPPDALSVYDNGEAQLYHLRPQSPYQP